MMGSSEEQFGHWSADQRPFAKRKATMLHGNWRWAIGERRRSGICWTNDFSLFIAFVDPRVLMIHFGKFSASALLIGVFCWQFAVASAQDTGEIIRDVRIGFGGIVKLGHWMPVRIQVDPTRVPADARLELETTDSDGVPVQFRSVADVQGDGWLRARICIGRINAGLTIRLLDANERPFAVSSLARLADKFSVVPATEPLLLQLDATGTILLPSSTTSLSHRRVVMIDQIDELPREWFDFDGIESMVIATSGSTNLAAQLSAEQVGAVWRWVEMGGRLLISVGENAGQLTAADGRLERFAPGTFKSIETLTKSDAIEFYTGSVAGPLITDPTTQGLLVSTYDSVSGPAEVRQDQFPLIHRRGVGFGEITFVSFDLEQPLVANWKGNQRLLSRLAGFASGDTGLVKDRPNTSAVNYGFRDLSGQVRATGERFRRVSIVTFMLVAGLIVLYAICLGPLDYFLLSRVVGRMEWTWLTSAIVTLVFAGIAWGIVRGTKPRTILVNHAEILDIDAESGALRGGVLTNLYSPRTRSFDLKLPDATAIPGELQKGLIASLGLPGNGIGGMESPTITRLFRDPYTIELTEHDDRWHGGIWQTPIAVASTKPFLTKWQGTHELSDLGTVTFREVGRQIGGTVRNPLPFELRDAVVLYGNTVYLYGDVAARSLLDLTTGTERSLKFYLQSTDANAETPRWVMSDRRVPRVFGMLMFFRVAGGEDFTGLTNNYLDEFDLSEQLALGRAVFLGRVDGQALHPLRLGDDNQPSEFDHQTSFVRIVYPVQASRTGGR
jgi:hypothetical protein